MRTGFSQISHGLVSEHFLDAQVKITQLLLKNVFLIFDLLTFAVFSLCKC